MDRETRFNRIRHELGRGEYLLAYDAAHDAAAEFPDDLEFRYCAALALARAGSSERAAEELEALELSAFGQADGPGPLDEDVAALGARLAKDQAVRASGDLRRQLAADASRRYEAVYRRFGDAYPCINAATMALLAGDRTHATELARKARAQCASARAATSDDEYWVAVTRAEAELLLDNPASAAEALRDAARISPTDLAARASTRRQLGLICEYNDIDPSVLDALPVPLVIHYCGHRLSLRAGGRLRADAISQVRDDVAAYFEDRDVGFAYGSLASGADLIVAEAALARGAELHLFLPFPREEFVATSVADAGESWVASFGACAAAATSITVLGDGPYAGDDVLFTYCARVAMGSALIRAAFLSTDAEQVAVWDRRASEEARGTSGDVAAWRARGMPTHVIATESQPRRSKGHTGGDQRSIRAMLFADVEHFSVLHDLQMASFGTTVLNEIALTLARYEPAILNRRTWGDGLHVVFEDVVEAAHCALDLHETLDAIDWIGAGFERPLALRVGAHAGPVIEIFDAVRDHVDFTGSHVVRTARIEPATPVGDVYVTDPFAALLTLDGDPSLSCQYVGHVPAAKGYGNFPMYVLKRRRQEATD